MASLLSDDADAMIGLPASVRIFLFCSPVDMRNGHDGLSGLVTRAGQDVYSGHLFVFFSRRRNRIKILTWDNGGFVLWSLLSKTAFG